MQRPEPPVLPPELDPENDKDFQQFMETEITPLLTDITEKTMSWLIDHNRTGAKNFARVASFYIHILTVTFAMAGMLADLKTSLVDMLADQMRQQMNQHRKPGD